MKHFPRVLLICLLLLCVRSQNKELNIEVKQINDYPIVLQRCIFKNSVEDRSKSEAFMKDLRETVQLQGSDFFLHLVKAYSFNDQTYLNPYKLTENIGLMKFAALYAIGLVVLVAIALQLMFGMIGQDYAIKYRKNYRFLKVISIIGLIGFVISSIFVAATSFEGLNLLVSVKQGLQQVKCAGEALRNIHSVDKKTYGIFDIPLIFKQFEKIQMGIWIKMFSLLRTQYFDSSSSAKLVIDEIKKVTSDPKVKQSYPAIKQDQARWINTLNLIIGTQNYLISTHSSKIEYQPIFYNFKKIKDQYKPLVDRATMISIVLSPIRVLVSQYLNEQSRENMLLLLKICFLLLFAIPMIAILSQVRPLMTSGVHNQTKRPVACMIIIVALMGFIISLVISLLIPYIGWSCEAGNLMFQDKDSFMNEIQKMGMFSEKSILMFQPGWTGNASQIFDHYYKAFYFDISQDFLAFREKEQQIKEEIQQVATFFERYASDKKNSQAKIQKLRASLTPQIFKTLYSIALKVNEIVVALKSGIIGSFQPQKVTKSLIFSKEALCNLNFNNLYAIRMMMGKCSYGLLAAVLFLLMVRTFRTRTKDGVVLSEGQTVQNEIDTISPIQLDKAE